jgi:hypothetical protein
MRVRRASVASVTDLQPSTAVRLARWLLLVSTAFGLAMMHTLGHAGMQMDSPPHQQAMAQGVVASAQKVAAEMVAPCPDCPTEHGMGWSICLAVLFGLAALALLAALAQRLSRRSPRPRDVRDGPQGGPRAPPPTAAGLAVVSIAVLRI